jgi:hypothetical protein
MFLDVTKRDLRALLGTNAQSCLLQDVFHMLSGNHARRVHSVQAQSVEQIQSLLQFAASRNLRVVPIGAGHSFIALPSDREVVLLRIIPQSNIIEPGSTVRLSSGATWLTVEECLRRHHQSLPVTTDYLGLTVAGTLCAGGYGIDSVRHGMQVDHARSMQAITATGEVVHCEPGHPLFDARVAGLFTTSVITDFNVSVIPVSGPDRMITLGLSALRQFQDVVCNTSDRYGDWLRTADLTWFPRRNRLTCRIGLAGAKQPDAEKLPVIQATWTTVELCHDYRLTLHRSVADWYGPFRSVGKVWVDYILPLEASGEFSIAMEKFCAEEGIEGALECGYMVPVCRPRGGPTLPFAGAAWPGRKYMLCGLYFMPVSRDVGIRIVARAKEILLQRCLQLGGRPYQQSRHNLSLEECKTIYGAQFESLHRAVSLWDPADTFGYLESFAGA